MGVVIGLSEIGQLRPIGPGLNGKPPVFTRRDRVDLDWWAKGGRSVQHCSSELGDYATLHEPGQPWASWGLVRLSRLVLLWDCVTLADIGRFPTMVDALAAIADEGDDIPAANVVQFAVARIQQPSSRSF